MSEEGAMDLAPVQERFPDLRIEESSGALISSPAIAYEVAEFLRDDPKYKLDYLSNVTGVDYLASERKEKRVNEEGKTEIVKIPEPARMDVVYHFYSMGEKHGPVTLKQRLDDRDHPVATSLTPLFRSAELQEREVYDLFGISFEGHPDLRRILMWEEFEDFPMRRDYAEPDDYEYEPTPHGEVLEKAKGHLEGSQDEDA
ncbi:MAG: NADH-quinone oxidoreductase subunit C [Opitutales bacterium]